MKPEPISESHKFLLRRRGIIETIFTRKFLVFYLHELQSLRSCKQLKDS